MIRPIIELGHPVLRTPADEVRAFDRDLAALVRDLEETVDHPGRAGLAAPQIGVGLRHVRDQRGQPVVVAEPDLVGDDGVVLVHHWYHAKAA